jgi:nitrogen fixation protein NifZ
MIDPRIPKFDWGRRVTAVVDLFNDGSYPEVEEDALLVSEGTIGEVVQVGMHEESSTPVYMVEFDGRYVVGCLEEEIEPVVGEVG